jgi:hypothetical protein
MRPVTPANACRATPASAVPHLFAHPEATMKAMHGSWKTWLVAACLAGPLGATAAASTASFADLASGCGGAAVLADEGCGTVQGHWEFDVTFDGGRRIASAQAQHGGAGAADHDDDRISGQLVVRRVVTQECEDGCIAALPQTTQVTFRARFYGVLNAAFTPGPAGQSVLASADGSVSGPAPFQFDGYEIDRNTSAPFTEPMERAVQLGAGTYSFSADVAADAFVPRTGISSSFSNLYLEVVGLRNPFSFDCIAAPVPEPATLTMALAGLGMVGWRVRRQTRA